jgi:MFS family permease
VIDWGAVARIVHVPAVVVWIGGVWMLTTILLPAIADKAPAEFARRKIIPRSRNVYARGCFGIAKPDATALLPHRANSFHQKGGRRMEGTARPRPELEPPSATSGSRAAAGRVWLAASLGTVFVWYDFYVFVALALDFAGLLFPQAHTVAALLFACGAATAGFLVRPIGALFFGRSGDLTGRQYPLRITILVMGFGTALTGLLPTFAAAGWVAPGLLVLLRLLQGFAAGGETGGAAVYLAEYAPAERRGLVASLVPSATIAGLVLALLAIWAVHAAMPPAAFAAWGWRLPFLLAAPALLPAFLLRWRLKESPVFVRIQMEGRTARAPLLESFFRTPQSKHLLPVLFGVVAGQGVVWFTGLVYAPLFLTVALHLNVQSAIFLVAAALMIGTPFFLLFGWLSDRIGRLKIILAGCLLAALTYFPLFYELARAADPDLAAFRAETNIAIAADDCRWLVVADFRPKLSACARARMFFLTSGLNFVSRPAEPGNDMVITIGNTRIAGFDPAKMNAALAAQGYKKRPEPAKIHWGLTLFWLVILTIYAGMVSAPLGAYLADLFPARLRYTSVSFSFHFGNGWFGGLLPLFAAVLTADQGNLCSGLWYPVGVAVMGFVVGLLFLPETSGIHLRL